MQTLRRRFGIALSSLSAVLALAAPLDVGTVTVSGIGHSFIADPQNTIPSEPQRYWVRDYLIDQSLINDGGEGLPSVVADWDSNTQFVITLSAPPGHRFQVDVPEGSEVLFSGFLWWESTGGGSSPPGEVAVSFSGLEGTPPDFSESDSVLADSHGFFGIFDIQSTPLTHDLAFSSIHITATVLPQYTGFGMLEFRPHQASYLVLAYVTSMADDPGAFVSVVPVATLSVDRVGGVATMQWSREAADSVLEWTGSLTGPSCTAVTNEPVISGDLFSLEVGTASGQRFYRLRRP